MQKKHPGWWLLFAACLALLAVLFLLLYKSAPQQPSEQLKDSSSVKITAENVDDEAFGKLKLGMTTAEVEVILGKPELVTDSDEIHWSYEALNITFHSFNERVSEIRAFPGCSFRLDSGIGLGSTREEVMNAYPLAFETDGNLDIDKVNSWIYIDDPDRGLQIGVTNGGVSVIIWKDYGNPLLEALTVNGITLYAAGGETARAIDKAAKRICATLTISEPEEALMPEGTPIGWMDFGNGTAVCLYDGDYAVVLRYEGMFDPEITQNQKIHLDGIFFGLGDAFAKALQNPAETW